MWTVSGSCLLSMITFFLVLFHSNNIWYGRVFLWLLISDVTAGAAGMLEGCSVVVGGGSTLFLVMMLDVGGGTMVCRDKRERDVTAKL